MDGHENILNEAASPIGDQQTARKLTPLPDYVLQSLSQELVARLASRLPEDTETLQNHAENPPIMEIDAFCAALVHSDPSLAHRFFDGLRARGATPDALSLRYIARAADRLGEFWVEDSLGFLEVTLGAARLHGLQRSLRSDFMPASIYQPPELTALFTGIPGDTHVLGLSIAADFFRRAGWAVDLYLPRTLDDLADRAARVPYTVFALSAGCASTLKPLEKPCSACATRILMRRLSWVETSPSNSQIWISSLALILWHLTSRLRHSSVKASFCLQRGIDTTLCLIRLAVSSKTSLSIADECTLSQDRYP